MDSAPPARVRSRFPLVALAAIVAVALVALAVVMTGPRPRPADDGLPTSPPPLAVPSDVSETSALAKAAALLAAGQLEAANDAFVDIVAQDQDGVPGQVGLVLSRWSATGPVSVERDLRQLAAEYPDDAFVALHLGLVQGLLGEQRAARVTLADARRLGRAAADPTSLRMAILADDVLHPKAFRGPMPVLVRPAEVRAADRPLLTKLLAAVNAGDRTSADALRARLRRSGDPLVGVAVAAAAFDKASPEETVDALDALAGDTPQVPEVRDRAGFLASLARLWGGADRTDGCVALERSTRPGVDAATRRLATPIHKELCAAGS